MANLNNGYEKRDVDYSIIHSESKEVFKRFIESMNLRNGIKLLDIGGGYGSVFVNISDLYSDLNLQYDLLDSSEKQLQKAKSALGDFMKNKKTYSTINYILSDAIHINQLVDTYDIVVSKMFIHEIPEMSQADVIKQIFSVIKPGGCVLFWTADLQDYDRDFYDKTIRKKDELAGFDSLVANRHFLLNSQLETLLKDSGFTAIEKLFDFNYDLHTSLRLESEFHGNNDSLKNWHNHILDASKQLNPDAKKQMLVEVSDSNIHIRFKRAIFKAIKV